jgi:hypothetical protein
MGIFKEQQIAKIWIENDIMNIVFHPETVISIEDAKKVVQERIKLCNNKDYPIYADVGGVISIDAATRKYFKGPEARKNAKATAMYVNTPISRFLGNLFMKVDRPIMPTKMFTNREKALKWLNQFK